MAKPLTWNQYLEMLDAAKKGRQEIVQRWQANYELFRHGTRHSWLPQGTTMVPTRLITGKLLFLHALLTQQLVVYTFDANGEEDRYHAETWKREFPIWQRRVDLDDQFDISSLDMLIYGIGPMKVYHDEEGWQRYEQQTGQIRKCREVLVGALDPRYFFPDPGSTDAHLSDADFVILEYWITHDEANEYLKSLSMKWAWDEHSNVGWQPPFQRGPTLATAGETYQVRMPTEAGPGRRRTCLHEIWHHGGKGLAVAFPEARIFKNLPLPYHFLPRTLKYPVAMMEMLPDPHFPVGLTLGELLEGLEEEYQKRRGQLIDSTRFMGAPWRIVPDSPVWQSLVQQAGFPKPGETYLVKGLSKEDLEYIKEFFGKPIDSGQFQLCEQSQRDADIVSGIFNETQGLRPKGVTAAAAIRELIRAAGPRIAAVVKRFKRGARDVGRLRMAIAAELYDVERVWQQDGQTWALIPGFILPMMDVSANVVQKYELDEVARAEIGLKHLYPEIIDEVGLLELLNWPDPQGYVKANRDRRIRAMFETKMQVQQISAQMGMAAGEGGPALPPGGGGLGGGIPEGARPGMAGPGGLR